MTLQELQKQALQLSIRDRTQLVQTLLESLKRETQPTLQRKNLSRLLGIAKSSVTAGERVLAVLLRRLGCISTYRICATALKVAIVV